MRKRNSLRRNRIVARWSAAASNTSFRFFAETVSQKAREAYAETNSITVERVEIWLKRLPKEFDKFRVVQLSDVHHSPFTDVEQVTRAVEVANSLDADLIALTGDYVSHEAEFISPVAEMLGRLRAKHGVYAILGNHDHWTDAELLTTAFRDEGIKVLINQGFRFEKNNASFWLAGVDDTMVGLADLHKALHGSKLNEMKFVLCHNPVILRRAEREKVDLVLSGHTHGGQIKVPGENNKPVLLTHRRASGLHRRGETQIYITRGIGTVVVPVRYQCPPEVSLLELRAANY
jgi:hypothetical protein